MEAKTLELSDTPYPGLRPFRADEADIFFGRERQTDDLLARLAEHRFLAVVGPSGCGKSSLVAAGLMPALATGFMATAGAHWRVAKLRPGDRPLANLAAALVEARILDDERAAQPDAPVFLEAALRRGPLGLVEILRGSALAPDANLLVLVDQFEELFRFSAGVRRDEAEAFVALLLASAAAPRERIYIAITMRSDFLGECAPFHGLPEAINDGLYLTPRLTRDECAACVTGPARVFDADVEPALVNRLLNDFGPDPDQLPLLQHAMLRMWNRHVAARRTGAKTVLTVADYDAIGGLARSLSDHADEAFGELGPDHQRIAKQMFQRLSDSETARRDRRAPAHVREIAEIADASVDDVRRVADVFRRRDRCFLMPREEIELAPDTVLDISHESLLRQWGRAVGWIEAEAEAVATYRRLREAAHAWRTGEALLAGASLDRALAWCSHVTARWALRYGTREDFDFACELIHASEQDRDAKQRRRNHSLRMRRAIAALAFATLTTACLIAWVIWPLLYEWEHTSYYASHGRCDGAPCGLGKLTEYQRQHRPLSFRVITTGLLGRVVRMDAVNSRNELTEVNPEYSGTERGRHLTTSHWMYEYDAAGRIAAEYQYTNFNELVQGKIYVSRDTGDVRRAMFIDANGTQVPVRGGSSASTYYWAEAISDEKTRSGSVETTSYLGPSGEPVPGTDQAFASQRMYDGRGSPISVTSLDTSGRPMNDGAGSATLIEKTDEFGNAVESVALDKHGHRTKVDTGWTTHRVSVDAFGNSIEEAYFDENDQPVTITDGWHRLRVRRDERGSIVETRYFDQDDKPTTQANGSCYGATQQRDAMDRVLRSTCLDPTGSPMANRFGVVTWTSRYDDRGRKIEESTWDIDDRLTAGEDAVATRLYRYDDSGRQTETRYLGTDGRPVISDDGYAKAITSYDVANRTERTLFYGVDGEPILLKEGHCSVQRKRDMWWNIVEKHYYDDQDDPVITSDGTAGWRSGFDTKGQEVERVFLGKADEAIVNKDGYASWQADYDDLGRKTAVRYLDLGGKPIANADDGVAGWSAHHDAWGHPVEVTYLGMDGKPTNSIHGDAGWRAEYDGRGNRRRLQYFDLKGNPTLHAWNDARFIGRGYALVVYTFDTHSNRLEDAFFDIHGERVASPEGWSYARYVYSDLHQKTLTSYFGTQSEPVKPNGYHVESVRYDTKGNEVETRYFDTDSVTPVISSKGFSRRVRAYDLGRHVVEEMVFGTRGERATNHNGAHRTIKRWDVQGRRIREEYWGPSEPPRKLAATGFRFDRWGNEIEERHLDANDRPTSPSSNRCATRTWRYSDRQELVGEGCQDSGDAPAPFLENGAATIAYFYDRPGERIKERYYDTRDSAFVTAAGFAGVNYKRDPQGREIETVYVDGRGNQVLTAQGYARITSRYARVTSRYDESGDLVEAAYFQANDAPTLPVAKVVSEFDVLRRKVTERYFGPGGRPALLNGRGQHVTLYDYDAYGNVQGLRYLDARERPTQGFAWTFDDRWQLCTRWVVHYDDDGNLVGSGECRHDLLPAVPVPAVPARSADLLDATR
jgi:hypothetical protein